jgi:tRNA (guanine37-N1)-methyltransferase
MVITILTIFPGIFESPLKETIIKRAIDKGLVAFNIINIRDFAEDRNKQCDDSPYGGGPGMVMKIKPIYDAMQHIESIYEGRPRFILLTPQGRPLDMAMVQRLSKYPHLCLICGRYEGVDERILNFIDEEISIGDYVLSGGETAALVVIDAVIRQIPGALGNEASVIEETMKDGLLEYPQYTRPKVFMDLEVPQVLLSGNHEEIRRWRRKEALKKTILKRPDLFTRFFPTEEDRRFIREIMEEIPEQ